MSLLTVLGARVRDLSRHACLWLACALPLAPGLCAGAVLADAGQSGASGTVSTTAPTASTTATTTWTRCAGEDQTCVFDGTHQVRYGANGSYAYRTATGSVACTNAVFGDPAYGYDKTCDYDGVATTSPPATTWTRCAVEDQVCAFSGTRQVRYGANGSYAYQTATGSISCSNAAFGDPAYGVDKSCDYGDAGTAPPSTGGWIRCAAEDELCAFPGTLQVRYGANGSFAYTTATGSVRCSNAVFGDPAYGVDKYCDYQAPASALPSALSDPIPFPIVPVAAANLPNGKVLTWASYSPTTYGGDNGSTSTALFDPSNLSVTEKFVANTNHDMFCPGTSMLADGRLLVSGGASSYKTSIYNYSTDTWTAAAPMNIARGYQGNVTLSDGSVLTLGGSWGGTVGGKNAELWKDDAGWVLKPGIPIDPFITPDPDGVWRGDNHAWLFAQPDGRVFQAGPGVAMHWIDTAGNGAVRDAGTRGDDVSSMNGNAVMYDIGKILKLGGAPAYEEVDAVASAYVIDIADGGAKVGKSPR